MLSYSGIISYLSFLLASYRNMAGLWAGLGGLWAGLAGLWAGLPGPTAALKLEKVYYLVLWLTHAGQIPYDQTPALESVQ